MAEEQNKEEIKPVVGPCLRFIPIGGQNELGKNFWLFESVSAPKKDSGESEAEYIIVDSGVIYPGYEQPGVDYLLANSSYLAGKKIKAMVLTSAHESHMGGAHQVIKNYKIKKVIGSKLAIERVKLHLDKKIADEIEWQEFKSREEITESSFKFMPFRVTGSAAESYAVIIEAQNNRVFYSGTYKLDQTPIDGKKMDLAGIVNYCVPGEDEFGFIDVYMGDSANVELEGYSSSEFAVLPNIKKVFESEKARIIFNTYAANTLRLQTLFDLAKAYGRKVALLNKDAKESYEAAMSAGVLDIDKELVISIRDIDKHPDEEILIISTAPEGEALRELELIATDRNLELQLKEGDVVVNSADPPPGTVRIMAQIADQFFLKNVKIIGGRNAGVNVHTHALTEEMKFMFNLIRPKFFIPALGETRHLVRHAKLAVETGLDPMSIVMMDNGNIAELRKNELKLVGTVPTDEILFNHERNFDVDDKIIKDRETLSMEGVVMISFSINKKKKVVAGPVFSARACTFSKNKEWRAFCMMNTTAILDEIDNLTSENPNATIDDYQTVVREFMTKVIKQQIGKKPSVIVFGSEV